MSADAWSAVTTAIASDRRQVFWRHLNSPGWPLSLSNGQQQGAMSIERTVARSRGGHIADALSLPDCDSVLKLLEQSSLIGSAV
jgi:hypothetical protein